MKSKDLYDTSVSEDNLFYDLQRTIELIGSKQLEPENEEIREMCERIASQPKEKLGGEDLERWSQAMAEWIIGPN